MGCWKGNRRGEGNGIGGGRGREREGGGGRGREGEGVRRNCLLYSFQTIILSGYGSTCDCMRLHDGLFVILT